TPRATGIGSSIDAPRPTRTRPRRDLGRHPRELPAGHVQNLPVHVVRPRRAEEEDPAGSLLGGGGPPDRDHHHGHLPELLGDAELDLLPLLVEGSGLLLGGREPCLDEPERDRVHVYLELTLLL